MISIVINWKTMTALGAAVVSGILAVKMDKTEAKATLEHLAEEARTTIGHLVDVIWAPKNVINKKDN